MLIGVTGGTGYIGAHCVRLLSRRVTECACSSHPTSWAHRC